MYMYISTHTNIFCRVAGTYFCYLQPKKLSLRGRISWFLSKWVKKLTINLPQVFFFFSSYVLMLLAQKFPRNLVCFNLCHRLLKGCCCKSCVTVVFVTSQGENFDPGSETWLLGVTWSFLCSKVLLKCNVEIGKASDIDIRKEQKECPLASF